MSVTKAKYTSAELNKINEFLLRLLQENNYGRIKIVYRGDKIESLFQRLNIFFNPDSINYSQALERLFMVGEKGKHFYARNDSSFSGNKFRIEDIGGEFFTFIFDVLSKASKSKKKHLLDFFRRNDSFKQYFIERSNKHSFLATIENLDDRKKNLIKNYYLTLLHQLAALDYKKKSMHVSTTEDRNIAIQFAGHSRQSPAFLLHVWAPTTSTLRKCFKGTGLPIYQQAPFKKQKEISFFAGILPQYIICFEVIGKKNKFYNPAIQTNNITPFTFIFGLDIDQANFENVFRQTNYSAFFSTDGVDFVEFEK
jgi:hypothetical protein